jgi:hypothetical protein
MGSFLSGLLAAIGIEFDKQPKNQLNNNDLESIEKSIRSKPGYAKGFVPRIYGGRQRTQKRKSVHGRPTRRRLYKSH